MNFIDTHAHIYFHQYEKDIDSVINNSLENLVNKILMPNINSSSINKLYKISDLYKNICYPMIGLHPCYVDEDYENELKKIKNHLNKKKVIAIGEIGIDLYREKKFFEQQLDAFETQCYWALENKLPVVIHTRNSLKETINIISKPHFKDLNGIFHCFDSSYEDAMKLIDLGFLIGIGGILTFKNSNLRETIAKIGIEKLVLETDSPYLSPEPYRGKRNEPANILYIAEMLQKITSIPLAKISQITTKNANELFDL
ncbi:MAG: hydrolase TatD [Flammeovirgaceae bacterium]|nr:hydrolase TatD [Flammeovirgaceae bacterium]|tara:strand:- start:11546 stop:12313 length:768 start_codon:yes stop_codon:yes gene_type:complete